MRKQAAWWGHPITSGLTSIDYFLGLDAEVAEAGHQHYSEQLLRMELMNSAPFFKVPSLSHFSSWLMLMLVLMVFVLLLLLLHLISIPSSHTLKIEGIIGVFQE